MKKKKNNKGFTLIELLAVIIILGILMIIAIPSVTSYINNSRKSAYVDTAKEIISGARNFVNEGKLEMFDTGTTYYIPVSCVSTENGQKSPYGDFVEDQAFVIVTYTGKNYNYYWISRDTTGQGVKTITPAGELDEDDIVSDISSSEITPTEPAETGKTTIKVLSKDDCKTFGEGSGGGSTPTTPTTTAATQLKTDAASDLYNIPNTDIYIFKGGNPANYVSFNGETWRIIGIYGDQIKIQRTTALESQTYHGSTPNPGWANSRLYGYLNQETEEGYYYSLTESAKNLIAAGTWNAGAAAYYANASEAYTSAIATPVTAKVGIMASYEFLYASDGENCETTAGTSGSGSFNTMCGTADHDWMKPGSHSWTLSPSGGLANNALRVSSYGFVDNGRVNNTYAALPAVFLDSSVTLASGSGSGASPSDAYVFTK